MYVDQLAANSAKKGIPEQKKSVVEKKNTKTINTDDSNTKNQQELESYPFAEKWKMNNEKAREAYEMIQKQFPQLEAKYQVHEQTQTITIRLVDRETQEVIREIPSERMLDLAAQRMELSGVLVDKKL